ncbi:uncharacterized protein BJX67DRAFT_358917 [Aspergillus lucknowensis]|uniref:Fungal-specific transcription factor domain-containing protein n=1 Tax=Aspergillus lucknowensis TaxID=176173 RepID=A0ABR4LLN3_9EURO
MLFPRSPTQISSYSTFLTTRIISTMLSTPPAFMHDYSTWWSGKAKRLPLSPEFTCLLLRVLACSAPYLDDDTRQKLEYELGKSIDHLSVLYHSRAKQLSSAIAPGKGGLWQVQQLFLTAQWYKTEARFVESWHALSTAIHEAQEQGMHRVTSNAKFSDFDREMRRRLWCILYAWDWQMSLLLSRPFIVSSSCCNFQLPSMELELVDSHPGAPSPIAHMALQCQLGLSITKIPGVMSGVISPNQAMSIQQETEKWFDSFPSAYAILDPDTRWDATHHFLKLQRFQLHIIGYMMMLMPLKQCLTKHFNTNSSSMEKGLRMTAVENALKLLRACDDLLRHILPMNAKFHFAPFLMFDTTALLCSAILHDEDGSLPQRDKILEAIPRTLSELARQSERAKTGMVCYTALKKLAAFLPSSSADSVSSDSKSQSSNGASSTLRAWLGSSDPLSCFPTSGSPSKLYDHGLSTTPPSDLFPSDPVDGYAGLADLSTVDLGELGEIWDWGHLEIDFPPGTFI